MDVSHYGDTLALFCDALPLNASVLDVACGPGNLSRFLLDRRADLQIFGTDLAPNMVSLAEANVPEGTFSVSDMRQIASVRSRYDAIVCGFGLPYLSKDETAAFLADIPNALRENGWLYLSTMTADTDDSRLQTSSDGKDTVLTHYHAEATLLGILTRAQFAIVHSQKQPFPNQPDTTDLIIIAQSQVTVGA